MKISLVYAGSQPDGHRPQKFVSGFWKASLALVAQLFLAFLLARKAVYFKPDDHFLDLALVILLGGLSIGAVLNLLLFSNSWTSAEREGDLPRISGLIWLVVAGGFFGPFFCEKAGIEKWRLAFHPELVWLQLPIGYFFYSMAKMVAQKSIPDDRFEQFFDLPIDLGESKKGWPASNLFLETAERQVLDLGQSKLDFEKGAASLRIFVASPVAFLIQNEKAAPVENLLSHLPAEPIIDYENGDRTGDLFC